MFGRSSFFRNVSSTVISIYGIFVLGGAYIFEFGFGYLPCQLCLYQRIPWAIVIIIGVISFATPKNAKLLLYLASLILFAGTVLAIFHAGIEYSFWDGLESCGQSTKIAIDSGSLLSSLETETIPSCDIPAWTLFGISLSGYNALLSLDAGIFAWLLAKK